MKAETLDAGTAAPQHQETSPHALGEVELIQKALSVLGPEQLIRWMQTSVPALRGRTPYSLMDSEEGRKQVEIELGRIEHGIY